MAKRGSTNEPAGADLDHGERLEMAAAYVATAMARIEVCVAAMGNPEPHVLKGIAFMLGEETMNDLAVAQEIFKSWQAQESRTQQRGRLSIVPASTTDDELH